MCPTVTGRRRLLRQAPLHAPRRVSHAARGVIARAIVAACAPLAWAVPAQADEAIRDVNNQESLAAGIAPLHAGEQATDGAAPPVANTAAGTRYLFGYDAARTRTIFGISDLYTDLDFLVGVTTLQYSGSALSPPAASSAPVNQAVTYAEEALRLRVGRSLPFYDGGRLAATPFLGVSQRAWARDAIDSGIANFHYQVGAEAGLLLQAALPWRLVFGAEAAAGRTLGTVTYDGFGNTVYAGTASFALKLDHRTFANWHQRLEVRQTTLRYATVAGAAGYFEPHRTADLAFLFEVGGETSVFDP